MLTSHSASLCASPQEPSIVLGVGIVIMRRQPQNVIHMLIQVSPPASVNLAIYGLAFSCIAHLDVDDVPPPAQLIE